MFDAGGNIKLPSQSGRMHVLKGASLVAPSFAMCAALSYGALFIVGCQPSAAEPRLVPYKALVRKSEARVKTGEMLPERIRKQISQTLENYFGTANEPRMFEPRKPSTETAAPSARV